MNYQLLILNNNFLFQIGKRIHFHNFINFIIKKTHMQVKSTFEIKNKNKSQKIKNKKSTKILCISASCTMREFTLLTKQKNNKTLKVTSLKQIVWCPLNSPRIHHLLNYLGEIHPSQKQMMILYYHYALSVRRQRSWLSLIFCNTYQIKAQTNYL